MTYIDDLAIRIYAEVVAQSGAATVNPTEEDWRLYRLYAVLLLAKGQYVSAEDCHNAWAAWHVGIDETDRRIKPYHDLSEDDQAAARPALDAIRQTAYEYARERGDW